MATADPENNQGARDGSITQWQNEEPAAKFLMPANHPPREVKANREFTIRFRLIAGNIPQA